MPVFHLAVFMADVRALHARAVNIDLSGDADVVHDLRVALRRCRSLAQGLAQVDLVHRRAWRGLAQTARGLFDGLGQLRDAQVMCSWTKVIPASHRAAIDDRLHAPLPGLIAAARTALGSFDAERWDRFAAFMPPLADQALRNQPLMLHLALARYEEARALHVLAMRRRDPASLHRLRVGVKRLRYTLESLLPEIYDVTGKPLKKMQATLGDLHDLDVLCDTLADVDGSALDAARVARAECLAAYKSMATGRGAWVTLRKALPTTAAVIERCRRAYVLEVADALGVDEHQARRAERTARALSAAHDVPLSSTTLLACLLCPAKRRKARRALKDSLGLPPALQATIRSALVDENLVDAVRALARIPPAPRA